MKLSDLKNAELTEYGKREIQKYIVLPRKISEYQEALVEIKVALNVANILIPKENTLGSEAYKAVDKLQELVDKQEYVKPFVMERLDLFCSTCGFEVSSHENYCSFCGQRIKEWKK